MIVDTDLLYATADVLADCGGADIRAEAATALNDAAAEIDKQRARIEALEDALREIRLWSYDPHRAMPGAENQLLGIGEIARKALKVPDTTD